MDAASVLQSNLDASKYAAAIHDEETTKPDARRVLKLYERLELASNDELWLHASRDGPIVRSILEWSTKSDAKHAIESREAS